MRYYSIIITDPVTGQVVRPPAFASLNLPATYTSFVNGRSIPGALNVELDVPVVPFATPMGAARVCVWGISLQEIGQAADLNNKLVEVYAGMQKGLPLANPAQSGLIVRGFIFQAFGNWIGTDMTLELIINPGSGPNGLGTLAAPKNLVLNWRAGVPMGTALKNTLSTAYPGFQTSIDVSSNLVRPNDEVGYFQTVTQLAQYLKQASKDIVRDASYPGVDLVLSDRSFQAYDGTKKSTAKMIGYQDLIGQPTWIEAPLIQFKTVMRADLKVGDVVRLPKTVVTNSQQAQSSLVNQRVNFQGDFAISVVRHVGNFRQADAASWVTVFNAYPQQAGG